MKKSTLAVLILLAYSGVSFAQGEKYFGIDYAMVNSESTNDDWDTGMLFGRIGMQLQPGLAVEGYLGLGIQDDETTTPSGCDTQTVSTDSIIGAQIKASADLDKVNLHANIGFNQVSATFEISGAASCYGLGWSETYDDDETGISFGFGADFEISDKSAISANYTIFYDDDYAGEDITIGGLLIGYKQAF